MRFRDLHEDKTMTAGIPLAMMMMMMMMLLLPLMMMIVHHTSALSLFLFLRVESVAHSRPVQVEENDAIAVSKQARMDL